MRNIIFTVIASALVSIAPFLALFDPNCFPTHGILIFGIFIVFLLYANIKAKIVSRKKSWILVFAVYSLTVAVSWIDLQGILKLMDKTTGFYGIIPFVTPAIALLILKDVKAIPLRHVNLLAFSAVFIHLVSFYTSIISYPILSFPILNQIHFQDSTGNIDRTVLKKDELKKWQIYDATNIESSFIDTTRSNVIILVESWGIPLDINEFTETMDLFSDANFRKGIHKREFSSTRKAEIKDFDLLERELTNQYTIIQLGQKKTDDSVTLKSVEAMLDTCNGKCAITLTTNDTKFPFNGTSEEILHTYKAKLTGTLSHIKKLTLKYPNVNFIIHGDHEPILSPIEFQEKFYKRWVPFVVTKP